MDPSTLPLLAQLGLAAPFAFALGWIGKKIWDRGDRLEKELKELNSLVFTQVLPAMAESSSALRDAARFMDDIRMKEEVEKAAEQRVQEILKSRGQS